MASTEISNTQTPVGVQPVVSYIQSTYASATWTFPVLLPGTAKIGMLTATTRSSAGIEKNLSVTLNTTTNVVTIASGGTDTVAAGDVAQVVILLTY